MFPSRQLAIVAAVAIALTFLTPLRARAQDDANYHREVYNRLLDGSLMRDAANHQFRHLTDLYRRGYIPLGAGNYQTATFHLEEGYFYRFIGACDSDCIDMDFYLTGPDSNNVIVQDTDPDATPGFEIAPRKSGDYTLTAKIPRCNAFFGCYWAVAVMGK